MYISIKSIKNKLGTHRAHNDNESTDSLIHEEGKGKKWRKKTCGLLLFSKCFKNLKDTACSQPFATFS